MRKELSFSGAFFLSVLCHSGMAQVNSSLPNYFDQFFNNYYLLNPANTDSSYKISVKFSDKTQIGLFQGINKIYLDADLKVPSSGNNFHCFGIQAINNKEGDFIHKNKFTGRYSWRTQISEKSFLSAGISLGFINYSFSSSQAGGGGSSITPDGNAGIWYLRKNLSAGFSIQQIFNGKIRPVNQPFILNRYYNFTAKYFLKINPFLNIHTHAYSGFQKGEPVNFALASLCELHEKLEAGINYHPGHGLIYVAGLKKIRLGTSLLSFYFSYFAGNSNINVRDNALEIQLSYQQ
ncbi:MAG: type IX secretion system membrane protein PorP/SprF [Cytophagaceae bacterium]|nr:type IX secretion system membrane protein PorP/SprF [Cytophagaceae bacterium]